MHLTRRFFLKSTGAACAYLGVCPVLPALSAAGASPAQSVRKGRTLVVIFLRGGADGLNLVVPHADPAYAPLRRGLAVGAPGTPGGAIDLDGAFGLNPRLGALRPLFDQGRCVALHAVGYDRNTRSHFEEQDTWETGVVGNTIHSDGWLNRHLATSAGRGPVRAVSIGDALPRIMQGRATAYAVRGLDELKLPRTARELDPARVSAALERAYQPPAGQPADGAAKSEATDLLARSAGATLEGVRELDALGPGPKDPPGYPKTDLARKLAQVARLIKADVGLEVAEVDLGGWDTHQNQGRGPDGALGNLAQTLADALAAFHTDLGDRMDDVLVLTLSDFGRTAAENGTGGTDHGWASCMFALGGPVQRGLAAAGSPARKVLTRWPGLAPDQLHDRRDLLHTTDFRDVLGEVVSTHLGNRQLKTVLPSHDFKPVGLVA